jgi:hypothetical protein
VDLARIRSGHHTGFRAYKNRLDESEDPTCPQCQMGSHDLEHWFLDCGSTALPKHIAFGEEVDEGLGLLTKRPKKSIDLARRTLLGSQNG